MTGVLVVLMAGTVHANEAAIQWRQLGSAGSLHRGRSEMVERRMAIATTAVAQVNHVAHHLRNSTTFLGAFSRRLAKKAAKQAGDPQSDQRTLRHVRDLTRLCRSLGRLAALFEGRAATMDQYVQSHPPTTSRGLQLLERDIDRALGAVKGIGAKLVGTTSKLKHLVRNAPEGEQHGAELLHQSALRVSKLGSVVRMLERAAAMPGLTSTNVAALARDVVAGYAKGPVSIQFSGPRHATAVVSPRRIRRALAELLDNSLEAIGEQGAIRVTVKSDKKRVLVSVQDTGGGIAKDGSLIEGLGQPFISSKPDGFGLGLARVAEIAKAHGGSACLGNDPGHGVTVLISLPRTGPKKRPPN